MDRFNENIDYSYVDKDLGSGVVSSRPKEDDEPEKKEDEFNDKVEATKSEDWSDTPSVEGQFEKYPMFVRVSGMKTDSFVIPDDKEKIDKLLENYEAAETTLDPKIIIEEKQLNPLDSGKWMILLHYRTVKYRTLIKK